MAILRLAWHGARTLRSHVCPKNAHGRTACLLGTGWPQWKIQRPAKTSTQFFLFLLVVLAQFRPGRFGSGCCVFSEFPGFVVAKVLPSSIRYKVCSQLYLSDHVVIMKTVYGMWVLSVADREVVEARP